MLSILRLPILTSASPKSSAALPLTLIVHALNSARISRNAIRLDGRPNRRIDLTRTALLVILFVPQVRNISPYHSSVNAFFRLCCCCRTYFSSGSEIRKLPRRMWRGCDSEKRQRGDDITRGETSVSPSLLSSAPPLFLIFTVLLRRSRSPLSTHRFPPRRSLRHCRQMAREDLILLLVACPPRPATQRKRVNTSQKRP